jgi:hypothetical protein
VGKQPTHPITSHSFGIHLLHCSFPNADAIDYIEMVYNPTCKHIDNGMLSLVDY